MHRNAPGIHETHLDDEECVPERHHYSVDVQEERKLLVAEIELEVVGAGEADEDYGGKKESRDGIEPEIDRSHSRVRGRGHSGADGITAIDDFGGCGMKDGSREAQGWGTRERGRNARATQAKATAKGADRNVRAPAEQVR